MKLLLFKMITIWVQLRDSYLYLFRHAIILNGYVDDHTWKGIRHRNWGDDINFYFIKQLSGRPVILYHNFKCAKWFHLKNYMCIGTLLDAVNYSNNKTIVWGSGVSGQDRDLIPPAKIFSVRGKLTHDFLQQRNIYCPEVYGDPALLLPKFYKPRNLNKRYKLGLIPHVTDLDNEVVKMIRRNKSDEIHVIDLQNYKLWTDVIDEICSCNCILSSSLHGLIVSDAYNVPNAWIELSGNISGGYFKFRDYASSVNRSFEKPFYIKSMQDVILAKKQCKEWKSILENINYNFTCCPF